MRHQLILLFCMAACACPAAGFGAEATASDLEATSIKGYFTGWAEVDAEGRLQAFVPDGKGNPAIVDALQRQLHGLAFVPARRSSQPIPVRTYLRGGYSLQQEGADYVLRLSGVSAGPKAVKAIAPQSPSRLHATRENIWARVMFVVDPRGRPKDIIVEHHGGSAEIERTARQSISRARFEPEVSNGTPIETVVRQEFLYGWDDATLAELPPCPVEQTGRVLAPGQSPCDRMEFVFSKKTLGKSITVNQP
jgi:TonB family protein